MAYHRRYLAALVLFMCAAIAGIGPRNEVAEFWGAITGRDAGGEGKPAMQKEHVLCMILLVTFLAQDFIPFELERKVAMVLFGPNMFGLIIVILFCLFDTSVGLYGYLEYGEFKQRDPTKREAELLISATNLVLVIAHIKTYRWRYCFNLLVEQRAQEADQARVRDVKQGSSLGRKKDGARSSSPGAKKEK